ncbi:ABC transporter substrate-binding protein [Nesterenkonia sp. F]|uniref:ABC transporter substrate-binding protein n=1 Tax=Nesterenkonia sp. F TaxID=795955 RepID=UPI000255D20B|nr:extracellular solute-binding protein [Nesterenkonia sp. F]
MTWSSRGIRSAALLSVGAVALTACGGGGGGEGDGDVTLRFTWWGSDTRHENTEEIIEVFEEENPGITVEAEYGDWSGYWDRLATQSAGGDAPDIMQMDEQYIREYAERGALLDLSDVDTSEFQDAAVEGGQTEDGLMAVSLGVVAFSMVANTDLYDEAGVDLPDDSTWTWEDYQEAAAELGEGTEDGVYGATNLGEPMGLQLWLRQQGAELFTEGGELALTVDQAAEYLEFTQGLVEGEGFPSSDFISETRGLGPEDGPMGAGESAMQTWWATQLSALSGASGAALEPLHMPSSAGGAAENGSWIKGAMFLSASADTDHPEEAKQFIEFFANSQEAGEINGMERGLPANLEVREAVLEDADGPEQKAAEFISEVEEQVTSGVPVPPSGFGQFMNIVIRAQDEVAFDRQDPSEAAETMVGEMETALQ